LKILFTNRFRWHEIESMGDFTHHSEGLMRWWNKRDQPNEFSQKTCDIEEDLANQFCYSAESRKKVELTIKKRRAKLNPSFYSVGMARTEQKQLKYTAWYTLHEGRIEDKLKTLVDKHTLEACPDCRLRHAARAAKHHARVARRQANAANVAQEQAVQEQPAQPVQAAAVKIEAQ
jgi:hypothetical protein